jgi:hypothetical protein
MNRNKQSKIIEPQMQGTSLGSFSLTNEQMKNLMAAQILSGMCANPRNFKFDDDDLASQSISLAEQIIDRTGLQSND